MSFQSKGRTHIFLKEQILKEIFYTKRKEGTGLRKVKDEYHDKIREMELRRTVLAEDAAHIKAIRKAYRILRVNGKTCEEATSET